MFRLRLLFLYILYLLKSKTKHGVHSPFVYDIVVETLNRCPKNIAKLHEIEKCRDVLLANDTLIEFIDLGAGTRTNSRNRKTTIKQIARRSLKNKKYARLMYNLVYYFKPHNLIELGTSLGITTAYMSAANSETKIISIEGSSSIANIAVENIKKLSIKNVEIITGSFDDRLNEALQRIGKLDFVFFDGNHRLGPTLQYFNSSLEYAHNDTVFVFDDIRWSQEMIQAWEKIKKHDAVTVTIDFFFIGIAFIRKQQAKEHFMIKY